MQNLLLLNLRKQNEISVKEIEQATGISSSQYVEYEQGTASIPDTDAELLSALFRTKSSYLKEYSRQLEYFSYSKNIIELKDKRIDELVEILKLYIKKESKPKQKTSKPKKSLSK